MSAPPNNLFLNLINISDVLPLNLGYESRMENNGDGNPIYVGYNVTPNAATDADTWFVFKIYYTGTAVTRVQLPDNGLGFLYAWDDRASYFS